MCYFYDIKLNFIVSMDTYDGCIFIVTIFLLKSAIRPLQWASTCSQK